MLDNPKSQIRWNGEVMKQLRMRRFTTKGWADSVPNRYRGHCMIVDICMNRSLRVLYPNGRRFVHTNLTLAKACEIIDAAFAADGVES
jgi:hypothetical protein